MRPIQVKQLDYDLTPTAGLTLVGHFLKTLAPTLADVDAALPVRTGVATTVPLQQGRTGRGRSGLRGCRGARPGKNVTGNSQYAGSGVWGKLVQLLTEAKAGIRRIAVLWGYVPPFLPREELEPIFRELRSAESALQLSLGVVNVADPKALPGALAQIEKSRPDALFAAGFGLGLHDPAARGQIMALAERLRLPTVGEGSWGVAEPTPLLYYAPLFSELMRAAVAYVDKILNGAKPGDLPIQLPSRFELVINRKAAQAIGLTLPSSLLLQADRTIE